MQYTSLYHCRYCYTFNVSNPTTVNILHGSCDHSKCMPRLLIVLYLYTTHFGHNICHFLAVYLAIQTFPSNSWELVITTVAAPDLPRQSSAPHKFGCLCIPMIASSMLSHLHHMSDCFNSLLCDKTVDPILIVSIQ